MFSYTGCKLWLRATLSPSVMRNTLLGQCFHTRNEKSHKEIFDLFSPFLQACLSYCIFIWVFFLSLLYFFYFFEKNIVQCFIVHYFVISCFQSLEALQDGEHEKQRRHFLYFLLHQVTVSSNFSMLMRKKACQVVVSPSTMSKQNFVFDGNLQC